jgi:GNAT superfamily N-acetyltransferase
MNNQIKIRFAKPTDINQIIDLCELHAIYEKSEYKKADKAEQLANDLFSDIPKLYCLVVEDENELIGYATYMKQYATWDAGEYIYMDCLFIKESARSLGIGEKLVRKIQKEGEALGCNLIQWQTPDFNVRAIKFYNRIGATSKSKERFFLNI